jgi:hypothetical protein
MRLNLEALRQKLEKKEVSVSEPLPTPSQAPVLLSEPEPPAPQLPTDKLELIDELSAQMARVKKERAILSSATPALVDFLYQKLKAESLATANEFIKGNLPMPELAEHASKIQAKTDEWTAVWDKIRYVEQYGKLPSENTQLTVVNSPTVDVSALTAEIRRLDDLIHKTQKKLITGKPKNADRINEWKMKIVMAESTRDELKRKRKNLQYGARSERTNTE